MKNLLIILLFLVVGCSSEAQVKTTNEPSSASKRNLFVQDGILMSFEGIDVSKYELDVANFDLEEVTKNNLLCLATDECDEALVIELIEKGADVNFKCEEVDHVLTNLVYCEDNGRKLTKLFLDKGANINGADQDNASFLLYAISADNLELSAFLIENGANTMQRDTNRNMGCLPVHGVESVEMLKLLLSKEFDVTSLCDNGRNLLHFAAKENLQDVAQYLVTKQLLDINHKDKNGETPLDYAIKFNHPEITAIIKKKQ